MKEKILLYIQFVITLFITSFLISFIAIMVSGTREIFAIGLLLGPLVTLLIFNHKLNKKSILIKLFLTLLLLITAFYSTLLITEVGGVKLGLDYYGYFDFLVIFSFILIILLEILRLLWKKYKKEPL